MSSADPPDRASSIESGDSRCNRNNLNTTADDRIGIASPPEADRNDVVIGNI